MKYNYKLLAVILIQVVLVTAGVAYFVMRNNHATHKISTGTKAQDGTQFPGPTDQEKLDNEANKKRLAAQTPDATLPAGAKRIVTPVITSVSQSQVRAFVQGIAEDNGMCTAIFTKDSSSFTKSSNGSINASTTNCDPILLSRSDFSAIGKWSVVVSYASTTAQGTSNATTLEVQ